MFGGTSCVRSDDTNETGVFGILAQLLGGTLLPTISERRGEGRAGGHQDSHSDAYLKSNIDTSLHAFNFSLISRALCGLPQNTTACLVYVTIAAIELRP